MKFSSGEPLRFLLAGGFNTAITYLVYLGALQVVPYRFAYTASFALGIVLGYAINTWFVFKVPWSWPKMLAYPLVYLMQYVVGLLVLSLLVEHGWVDKRVAPLLVVIVTLPLTFVASRFLIKGKAP